MIGWSSNQWFAVCFFQLLHSFFLSFGWKTLWWRTISCYIQHPRESICFFLLCYTQNTDCPGCQNLGRLFSIQATPQKEFSYPFHFLYRASHMQKFWPQLMLKKKPRFLLQKSFLMMSKYSLLRNEHLACAAFYVDGVSRVCHNQTHFIQQFINCKSCVF